MKYVPELDGVRAVAIIPIIAVHATVNGAIGGRQVGFFLGVDIFFVLSGFLITSLLLAEERRTGAASLLGFYERRVRRILPALFASTLFALAIPYALEHRAVVAALTFWGNIPSPDQMGSLRGTWSLAVEEHFYLTWPLLFLTSKRWRGPLLVGIVLCAILARYAATSVGEWGIAYRFTICRADALAIGCLAALYGGRLTVPPLVAFGCGIAIVAFMLVATKPGMAGVGYTVFALLAAIVLRAVVDGDLPELAKALRIPVLRFIGTRSYGYYLYHYPILRWLIEESPFPTWGITQRALVGIAFMVVVSEVSYQTVESWFRRPPHKKDHFAIDSKIAV